MPGLPTEETTGFVAVVPHPKGGFAGESELDVRQGNPDGEHPDTTSALGNHHRSGDGGRFTSVLKRLFLSSILSSICCCKLVTKEGLK